MYRYLILALVLAGCAASASTFKRPADLYNPNPVSYPFHYSDPYVELFWRCQTPEAGGVSVEGYAASSTNANVPLMNFNVTLSAVDAEGRKLTRRFAWGTNPQPSRVNPVPFEVSVAAVAGAVRYDLYYDFQYRDGRTTQNQFATIEDVCGGRWRGKEVPPGS